LRYPAGSAENSNVSDTTKAINHRSRMSLLVGIDPNDEHDTICQHCHGDSFQKDNQLSVPVWKTRVARL